VLAKCNGKKVGVIFNHIAFVTPVVTCSGESGGSFCSGSALLMSLQVKILMMGGILLDLQTLHKILFG